MNNEPTTRIKILYVITGLSLGGAENMLLKVLSRLDMSLFEPYVISLTTKGKIGERIESLGVPVYALKMKFSPLDPLKFIILIFHILKINPKIVHTWMYHADLIGGLAAFIARRKIIIWGIRHGDTSPENNSKSIRVIIKLCALFSRFIPKKILFCSRNAQLTHLSEGYDPRKVMLIPNGFDLDRFKPSYESKRNLRKELKIADSFQLVGMVARFNPQKNHAGFIEMARIICKSRDDVRFVMVGSGVDGNNKGLNRLLDRFGLVDLVYLLGERTDINQIIASLDVLVSTSHGEAFPNVIGEAMASGVYCVVTQAGDSADIVGDTGFSAPVNDMESLAGGVLRYLNLAIKEKEALSAKARVRVLNFYEISRVIHMYESFYVSLLREL